LLSTVGDQGWAINGIGGVPVLYVGCDLCRDTKSATTESWPHIILARFGERCWCKQGLKKGCGVDQQVGRMVSNQGKEKVASEE